MFFGQSGRQAAEGFQRVIDGIQGWLLGVGLNAVGITANLIAGLLDGLAQADHTVELSSVVALPYGGFNAGDSGHGVIGTGAQFAARILTTGHGSDQFGEGNLVIGDSGQLFVDDRHIGWLFDRLTGGLEPWLQFADQIVDFPRTLFTPGRVIVHARGAQVLGQVVQAGDEPECVAACNHIA